MKQKYVPGASPLPLFATTVGRDGESLCPMDKGKKCLSVKGRETITKKIELNPQFKEALRLMDETNENIFITGRAGTGKSTLLEYFRSITRKKIVVLAPTGVAAVNIAGQTIHSFFGFRPDVTVDNVKKIASKRNSSIYKNLDAIVIDEVSMVRSDLLDCMDQFLRINGKTPEVPCGGLQMIFIGDLYQIPPVVTNRERQIFQEHYKSEYFFDSKAFQGMELAFLELKKIYRQTDPAFVELLNKIRSNDTTTEDLETINRRTVDKNSKLPKEVVYLTTTNAMADKRNEAELGKLPGKIYCFTAAISRSAEPKYFPAPKSFI